MTRRLREGNREGEPLALCPHVVMQEGCEAAVLPQRPPIRILREDGTMGQVTAVVACVACQASPPAPGAFLFLGVVRDGVVVPYHGKRLRE